MGVKVLYVTYVHDQEYLADVPRCAGVHDVGWNNPSSPTPTLDSLAAEGVILDSAYTLPVCTPSRAALMTGGHTQE